MKFTSATAAAAGRRGGLAKAAKIRAGECKGGGGCRDERAQERRVATIEARHGADAFATWGRAGAAKRWPK
jgi:hypothetical protein